MREVENNAKELGRPSGTCQVRPSTTCSLSSPRCRQMPDSADQHSIVELKNGINQIDDSVHSLATNIDRAYFQAHEFQGLRQMILSCWPNETKGAITLFITLKA